MITPMDQEQFIVLSIILNFQNFLHIKFQNLIHYSPLIAFTFHFSKIIFHIRSHSHIIRFISCFHHVTITNRSAHVTFLSPRTTHFQIWTSISIQIPFAWYFIFSSRQDYFTRKIINYNIINLILIQFLLLVFELTSISSTFIERSYRT